MICARSSEPLDRGCVLSGVIEDFDGPDPAPSRRGHMLVVSALLLVGVIAGYAAVSSPELRGPYATPRPSVVNAPHLTPADNVIFRPGAINPPVAPCFPPSVQVPSAFVGNTVRSTTYVYDEHGQNVIEVIRSSVAVACSPVIWGQPPNGIPFDRVGR